MSRAVNVRPARAKDIDDIYRVTRRNWEEVFGEFLPLEAIDWDAEVPTEYRVWLQTVIAHNAMSQLVAVTSGRIVGCAEFAWAHDHTADLVGEKEAELKAIHVSPDYWDEGIGSALFERGKDHIPKQYSGIALSVLTENERARGFYEHRGFTMDGTITTTLAGKEYTEAVYRDSRG